MRPRWVVFDEVLEGLEPEWQATLTNLLTALPETSMIYIGRSEIYMEILKPKVLHLEAIASKTEEPPPPPKTGTGRPAAAPVI